LKAFQDYKSSAEQSIQEMKEAKDGDDSVYDFLGECDHSSF
jgi:hypothetical protein